VASEWYASSTSCVSMPLDHGAVLRRLLARRERRVRCHQRIPFSRVMLLDQFREKLRCGGVHVDRNEVVRAVDGCESQKGFSCHDGECFAIVGALVARNTTIAEWRVRTTSWCGKFCRRVSTAEKKVSIASCCSGFIDQHLNGLWLNLGIGISPVFTALRHDVRTPGRTSIDN
jgi:hypothetical protein